MSWGERSCKGNKDCKPTMATCNVDCPLYESNGTEPDSEPAEPFSQEKFNRMLGKINGTIPMSGDILRILKGE
jgi:hypothetical protein